MTASFLNWKRIYKQYNLYFEAYTFMCFDRCMESCNCYHNQDREQLPHSQKSLMYLSVVTFLLCFHPQPLTAISLSSVPILLPFLKYYINGLIQCVVLCVWFLLFSIMLLKSIHIALCISGLFLFIPQKKYSGFLKIISWRVRAPECL